MRYYISCQLLFSILLSGCEDQNDPVGSTSPVVSSRIGIINDRINDIPIVVYGNEERRILKAFIGKDGSGKELTFTLSNEGFPNSLLDSDGNVWDILGNGVSQDVTDSRLGSVDHLVGYWFFFPSFYENVQLSNGVAIQNTADSPDNVEWLVNTGNIAYGSFRDGIRSIDQPAFLDNLGKNLVDHPLFGSLAEDELATVVHHNGLTRIYPHRILEYHEIVNDFIEDFYFTISFCPLTGTSKVWNREINGGLTEFGVSGLLFNNNLILYDRSTESNWSQILDLAVNGTLVGKSLDDIEVTEMKLYDALLLDGRLELLQPDSETSLEYNVSSYEEYKISETVLFPLANRDNTMPAKERVIGVTVDGITKVYRFSDFESN
jgi:hypothetical protein